MRTCSPWLSLSFVPALALAACGGGGGSPAADAAVDTSTANPQVSAICAISRAASCPTAATCEREVMSLYDSVPARCATQRSAVFACAAASRGTTCAMFAQGSFAGCSAQEAALDACADGDASSPSDATETDAGRDPPAPNSWLGPAVTVGLTLEGAGNTTPQGGEGTASLNIGPTGAPAGSYILSVASTGFPRLGASFDCRAGFTYNESTRSYAFSGDSLLTAPCTVTLDGMTTTLTFTGGTVSTAPAGNTVVRINLTGSGPLAMGAGVMQITYNPL